MLPENRRGLYAAAAVLVTHLLAALAMLFLLRAGLPDPATSAGSRLEFIRANRGLWWSGWLLWQLAAVSLLALYGALALRWGRTSPLLSLVGLMTAAAGIAADLAGQSLYMALPLMVDPVQFVLVERAAVVVTGYAANGLYTVAGLLITLAGWNELPKSIVAVSLVLWSAGFLLAAASLAEWAGLQQLSTGMMLASLMVWALMLGLWLRNRAS